MARRELLHANDGLNGYAEGISFFEHAPAPCSPPAETKSMLLGRAWPGRR